jgi:hypothetical protein
MSTPETTSPSQTSEPRPSQARINAAAEAAEEVVVEPELVAECVRAVWVVVAVAVPAAGRVESAGSVV